MLAVDIVTSLDYHSLPNDSATTEACLLYLKLKGIAYRLRRMQNAYSISPDGILPVSNINGYLVSGFMSMCFTLKTMNQNDKIELDPEALEVKNTHHIFFFSLSDVLRNLTLYFTWVEPNGVRRTRDMFNIYPWPLSQYYFDRQKKITLKYLNSVGWATEDCASVLKRFDETCKHLTCMLGEGPFIFNRKKAGKIDCLFAAYFEVFVTNSDYFSILNPVLSKYPCLSKLAAAVRSVN